VTRGTEAAGGKGQHKRRQGCMSIGWVHVEGAGVRVCGVGVCLEEVGPVRWVRWVRPGDRCAGMLWFCRV